jgi:hypothetical protein
LRENVELSFFTIWLEEEEEVWLTAHSEEDTGTGIG